MKVEVTVNQPQDGLTPRGGSLWTCYYDEAQKFNIVATAETDKDLGKYGLTQTLVTSRRVAHYSGGGTLTITPAAGLPCLDGDRDLIPWYNAECAAQALKAVNDHISLTLEDSPSTNVPSQGWDEKNQKHDIVRLEVSETFLVTLYEKEGRGRRIKQWTWEYKYVLTPGNGGVFSKPKIESHSETKMVDREPMQPIVVAGDVATDGSLRVWEPKGWKAPP